jgi:hypothetical protein
MSKRHRNQDYAPPARADLRAHAHNERHRVHSELHLAEEAMRHGTEPLDIVEPGPAWKPSHHHDPAVGIEKSRRRQLSIGKRKTGNVAKQYGVKKPLLGKCWLSRQSNHSRFGRVVHSTLHT